MTQEEIQQVLDRAQEIESQQGLVAGDNPDVDGLLQAAGEVGIQREAVMQALRERMSVVDAPLRPGDFVFARVPDGGFYPAKVTSQTGDLVSVQFNQGAGAQVQSSSIHRFRGLPNEPIYCEWPHRGWIKATVESFDPKENMVNVTGPGGATKWYALDELRFYAKPPESGPATTSRVSGLLYAAISLGSAIAGALAVWLAMRG